MCRLYLEVCVVDAFKDERWSSGLCGHSEETERGEGGKGGFKRGEVHQNKYCA